MPVEWIIGLVLLALGFGVSTWARRELRKMRIELVQELKRVTQQRDEARANVRGLKQELAALKEAD